MAVAGCLGPLLHGLLQAPWLARVCQCQDVAPQPSAALGRSAGRHNRGTLFGGLLRGHVNHHLWQALVTTGSLSRLALRRSSPSLRRRRG
jgi:hypothetical protein